MSSSPALPARCVSILGHPLLVLPLALLLPMATIDAAATTRTALGTAVCAAVVMGWSWWRVRGGHWRHVDASGVHERRGLNRFLLPLLALGALLALPQPWLALRLALAAAIVAVALLLARWCTLSLHAAFASYATVLLWAWHAGAGLAMLVFAGLIVASRLVLARHSVRDVVAGAAVGSLAGAMAWWVAP
ncbi:phosphatase PAP2 family protein [Luteimonas yindakuii]|uniref:Phosphatase PAP2 family protein n=1 Tax=Luteimonas yindakuii TaxID=2565782 RepID=A0A4Z1R3T2_9GAMM|nr:phosphatase PAP2 family protein [Luteimonas yindakuii]TKS54314.1 phosphatase PAP2 family protein [Luteimonas yindakuii]